MRWFPLRVRYLHWQGATSRAEYASVVPNGWPDGPILRRLNEVGELDG